MDKELFASELRRMATEMLNLANSLENLAFSAPAPAPRITGKQALAIMVKIHKLTELPYLAISQKLGFSSNIRFNWEKRTFNAVVRKQTSDKLIALAEKFNVSISEILNPKSSAPTTEPEKSSTAPTTEPEKTEEDTGISHSEDSEIPDIFRIKLNGAEANDLLEKIIEKSGKTFSEILDTLRLSQSSRFNWQHKPLLRLRMKTSAALISLAKQYSIEVKSFPTFPT